MIDELAFALMAALLLYAGANLARYGEGVAAKTHLSATWIGLFLLAAVTSVPELMTGVSSILLVDEPDFAAGDVLGSTVFNLGLAALAALSLRRALVEATDARLYRLSAIYLTLSLALVAMGLLLPPGGVALRLIAASTAGLLVIYFVASRHLFSAQAGSGERPSAERWELVSRRRVFLAYAGFSALVVASALALPWLAERIASARGLDRSAVGTLLLAGTTSLPEVVVTISAIRLGAGSLALGGLLGSNLFDLVILAVDDLFYVKGPLLAVVAEAHLVTVGASVAMTWLVVLALPADRRPRLPLLVGALVVLFVFLAVEGARFAQAP